MVLALWWNLLKLLPKFDMVHAHWIIPQGIVQSFFRKPYMVTGHGGDVTSLNKGVVRALKVRSLKRAAQITTVSDHLKTKVLELYPEANVSVISMGVDTEKFGKQYAVSNYFNQGDRKVVLFVGRLAEKKGVTYLIDAMENIDAKLVIVGDGPLKESLEMQAQKLGYKVQFLGSKTHEELRAIYASADLFAAPSVTAKDGDQEGLGLVMLEAMATGLPVVASNSGGISEIVKHEYNGLLAQEKDVGGLFRAIKLVLDDEKRFVVTIR